MSVPVQAPSIPGMDAPVHDSPYSWRRLALTLAIGCVGNVGMWSAVTVLPALQEDFGTGRAEASMPYMGAMVGFAVGNLIIGRLVDRVGMTLSLILAAIVGAAGFAASALAPTIPVLAMIHVVVGFGAAASFGPLLADISHWFLRRRGIAVALAACGNYLSGAIWPLALSSLGLGWRDTYLCLAALILVLVVPLALTLRRQLPPEAAALAETRAAERRRAVALSPRTLQSILAAAGVCCCVAMSMPQVHMVAHATDLGYGATAGARMLTLMLLGGVVSRIASGFLADRFGGVRTLLLSSALQMLALALYLPSNALWALYTVSAIFGLAQGGIVPSYAIIVREYLPAREAGARVGVVMFATVVGMALGGWMSGAIYDLTGSYHMAFLNGIAWNGVNLVLVGSVLILSRTRRPPQVLPA